MKKINLKSFLISVAIPLLVGGLAALITGAGMDFYATINKPALSPPSWLFPVVWTILYFLMGVSLYRVREKACGKCAVRIFAAQLAVNFIWSIVFFNARAYLAAFILIIVLWAAILAMIASFHKCDKTAAYLQIPYFFWVTFAAYLNWAIYALN